jgi:hypothetical protein
LLDLPFSITCIQASQVVVIFISTSGLNHKWLWALSWVADTFDSQYNPQSAVSNSWILHLHGHLFQ